MTRKNHCHSLAHCQHPKPARLLVSPFDSCGFHARVVVGAPPRSYKLANTPESCGVAHACHMQTPSPKDAARFWAKVETTLEDACWNWKAGTNHDGYGLFQLGPKLLRAHRVAYALRHGAAPDSLVLRHQCDNRRCVNPSHLLPGTKKQNMEEAVERGRNAHGERHGRAKLDEAKVLNLRLRYRAGEPIGILAAEFGVAGPVAYRAATGRTWAHIGGVN